ncbi:unnamed protein product [Polarella glacialis]|uniref:UBA domain-containing protein n=1 Tax=Polarella glacialis TaxID=89957 RepID=A0A813FRP0_POLGL|nr:unnamed protein product [Polarella glacialis]
MVLQKLSDAARGYAPAESSSSTKAYRWIEFANKGEQFTEFDESHFKLSGHFESNSSEGHKAYQDRLRSIHFRKEGKSKAQIATLLGRSEQFVAKWWQKEEREVPRPWGVHEYMAKELGSKTATNLATGLGEESVTSTAAWWRDIEIKRKYLCDPAIYEELLQNTEWKSSISRTRDFSTGANTVKYDKEGKMKVQGNQGAKYTKGSSPAFDKLLQKFYAEYGLEDRTSGIALNWYPDGDGALGSHRHDCWTALFSFGQERILTIDKTPLLLQDSDLVIFGTQRHGVPRMPEVKGGRITVPIFFYPDSLQMQKQWQTLTDPEDPRKSRELSKLQSTHQLGQAAAHTALWESDPGRAAALHQLLQLGFEESQSRAALSASDFDAERAAELLLMSGAGSDFTGLSEDDHFSIAPFVGGAASSSRGGRAGRWASGASASGCCVLDATDKDQVSLIGPAADTDADVAFALELQMEEESRGRAPLDWAHAGGEDEDVAAALAAQFEEEEDLGAKGELLAKQFEEYEEQIKRDSAEDWHGRGDLMQSEFVRETLSFETMDKVTCYSIGHGQQTEKSFYELLQLNSVRTLYDFRASDHRGDVHSPCPQFSTRALKSSCRVRGIAYKHIALGRETAYGILKHVQSDEAKHAMAELLWHAKRSRTAFLGFDQDWKLDHRQVVADLLSTAGHQVKHIDMTGAPEDHEDGRKMPDFIVKEEERLRKLEKQRQAGELKRPEKSSVDRSSEAVAAKLLRPAQEVDAMDELRNASNQVELVRAQRNLARLQRLGDKHGLMANKVVKAAPRWILDEAREQEEWIANKKAEKAGILLGDQGRSGKKGDGAEKTDAGSSTGGGSTEELMVECGGCGQIDTWSELALGDGFCRSCRASGQSGDGDLPGAAAEELEAVQCATCDATLPWEVLCLADGHCPSCAENSLSSSSSTNPALKIEASPATEAAPQEAAETTIHKPPATATTASPTATTTTATSAAPVSTAAPATEQGIGTYNNNDNNNHNNNNNKTAARAGECGMTAIPDAASVFADVAPVAHKSAWRAARRSAQQAAAAARVEVA